MNDEKALAVAEATGEVATIRQVQREHLTTQGAMALALLTDDQFNERLAMLEKGRARVAEVQKKLMRPGVDYGVIPGTDKPTLLKPGAETLCNIYGLVPSFDADITYGEPPETPAITIKTRAFLHVGSQAGPVVGEGIGVANSHEPRYRWRNAARLCPACGKPAIIKGKAEYGGGWLCFKKNGGCGAKYGDRDKAITAQEVGRVENPDVYELLNTIAKISEKRAMNDVTLRTLAISGLFTQDIGDTDTAPAGDGPAPYAHDGDDAWGGMDTVAGTAGAPGAAAAATQAPGPVAGTGEASGSAAPPTAAPGVDGMYQGVVFAPPDGVRIIRRPDWAPEDHPADTWKAEVAFKVGASKHTAVVLGRAFAEALFDAGLRKDEDTVRVWGERVEMDWPGRGNKPMRKEIHNVTAVHVLRDGQWQDITPKSAGGSAPDPTPDPRDGPTTTTGSGSTEPSTTSSTPTEPSTAAPAPSPADGPASPDPVPATGVKDETVDVQGTLLSRRVVVGRSGRIIEAVVLRNGLTYRFAVPVSDDPGLLEHAESEHEQFLFHPGDDIRVVGTWLRPDVAVMSAVDRP
jgi:hypothetical protein